MSDVSVEPAVEAARFIISCFQALLSMLLHVIPVFSGAWFLKREAPTQWLQCYCGAEGLRMSSRRPH